MIVLDSNVVLELIQKRAKSTEVRRLLDNLTGIPAVSTLTMSNVFYFTEKKDKQRSLTTELFGKFKIIGVIPEDVDWAFNHWGGRDFEDALQIASAIRSGANVFVTIDKSLAKKYGKFIKIELIGDK